MPHNKCYGCLRETVTWELKDYLDNVVGYWCMLCVPNHIRSIIKRNQNNTGMNFSLILNKENKIEIYRGSELVGVEPIKEELMEGDNQCSSHSTQDLQRGSLGIGKECQSDCQCSVDLMSDPRVHTVTIKKPSHSHMQNRIHIGSSPPPDGTDLTRQTITGRLSPSVINAVIQMNRANGSWWGMSDPIGVAMNDAEPGQEVHINRVLPTQQEAARQAQERSYPMVPRGGFYVNEANYEDFDPSELPF